MCGIAGIIASQGRPALGAPLRSMRDVMTARGPDGVGEYCEDGIAMAMRRLSIIDLEHGWQPLTSRNGQVVAFQNGEIYNFQTLRRELQDAGYVFRTNSDTEVLAHGYARWGINGLLQRVDGMYAIAILDRDRRELHLARDRFGEKPLFYAIAPGRFAYASDLRALAALPWVAEAIDPMALDRYLAMHYVPGDRTILSAIKRVLPGQRLRVPMDAPVPEYSRYYSVPMGIGQRVSDAELAERLESAVRSRLVADVPVGIFLSGGLDSSVVAAAAARANPSINTFSMGFSTQEHDESAFAREVAQHIGSTHHHFLFDEDRFTELVPQVAKALDEPVGDQALLPVFWLCYEARRHVKVVLSGEGADEVFAGYRYYGPFSPHPTIRDRLRGWLRMSSSCRATFSLRRLAHNISPITPSGFPLMTDVAGREALLGHARVDMDEWEQALIEQLDRAADPLQRATCADLMSWLPDDLLVKYDRMAMANSLEGRAPFLQPEVVDIGVRRLQPLDRMAYGETKRALRRAARHWLPRAILKRPKQGFVLPMRKWITQWFRRHDGVEAYFRDRPLPLLDMGQLISLVTADVEQGLARERLIFALILLTEWHEAFRATVQSMRKRLRAVAASS
jgi:asparagine synthase (glutamine-hydrolysing)